MSFFFLLALLAAPSDDFPLRKVRPLTWVVDYEPSWSPDGSTILCSRRLGDVNLILFPAPR